MEATEEAKLKPATEEQRAQAIEVMLADREKAIALLRYKFNKLDDEYRRRKKASEAAFAEANKGLSETLADLITQDAMMRDAYEVGAMELRNLRLLNGDNRAKLTACAEVKNMNILDYSEAAAIKYLVKHRLSQFLMLNTKAFEKAAEVLMLPFVTATQRPKVFLASNMVKALGLGVEDLAIAEAEIDAILNPPEEAELSAADGA
jgi:hypothetical protein